jgi:hypothetical protein
MHKIDADHFMGVYFNRVTFMGMERTEASGTETLFEEDGVTLFCEDTSEGIPNPKIEVFIADEILNLLVADMPIKTLAAILKHKRDEVKRAKG